MCEQCSTAVSKASVPSHAGIHVDEALVKKILAAYQKYVASIASQVGDLDEAAALDAIDEAIDWKGPRNELQRAFEDALGSVSLKGMDRGLKPLKSLEDYEKFKEQFIVENPYLKTWVEEHGAALVTEIDESTRAGLRETIGLAADESWTWSKLKREVKTKVGLLEKDSIAVQSLYDNLIEEGMDENAASDKAAAYSAKLHARRAENIARTEIIFAENYGQQAAFLTAKDVGLVTSATKRVWIESPNDGRRCPICAGLGNTESEIDGMWITIEGDEVAQPPAHPSCRCTMGLVTKLEKRVVLKGDIASTDDDQRLVFGWLSVVENADGSPVVDLAGDVIPVDVLESAAYQFVLDSRSMGDMHERIEGIGRIVESMVFTREKMTALGLKGKLPVGWWVGFHVDDDEVWAAIKSGEYKGLSIGGNALVEDMQQ